MRESISPVGHRVREVADIHFVPHDLRRTAASLMTAMDIAAGGFEIPNHAERGVTAVYDRYSYDAEKRQTLVGWTGRLDEILVDGTRSRNLVRIA